MSQLLSRLILAFTAVVAAPVMNIILAFFLGSQSQLSELASIAVAELTTAFLFVLAWILVWKKQVVWSSHRKTMTVLSVLWSLAIAGGVGAIIVASGSFDAKIVGCILGGMVWFVVWIASTALVWRETHTERQARLAGMSADAVCCLNCGYNMTGLCEARCPECGSQFTLNQLLGAAVENRSELGHQVDD